MRTKNIVPFIDVLFSFLLVFVCITMLLKVQTEDEKPAPQQNALYLITLTWTGNSDLDLWVQDSEGHTVGFNRREGGEGSLMSLNRDCLGANTTEKDSSGNVVNKINEEIISIRGIAVGEYIVNVHAYNMKGSPPTEASVKLQKNKPYKEIVKKENTLSNTGDEKTFFRFSLDKNENVSDINELQILLMSDH